MSSSQSAVSLKLTLVVALLFATGCQYVNFNSLTRPDGSTKAPGPKPLAVLSVAPGPATFDVALAMIGLNDPKSKKTQAQEKTFPGIDGQRPVIALLYLTQHGHADPLIYVPVADYEKFLDGLDKKFRLNRAISTTISIRRQQLMLMHVGDHAVFGFTTQSIKRGPRTPQRWADNFSDNSDIAFDWVGTSQRPQLKRLLAAIKSSFGSPAAQILAQAEFVALQITADPEQNIQLQARIGVDQKNMDQLKKQLDKLVSNQDSLTTESSPDKHAEFHVNLQRESSQETLEKIQLAMSDFFQKQAVLSRKRKSKHGGPRHSDQALNEFGNLLSGSSVSSSPPAPSRSKSGG